MSETTLYDAAISLIDHLADQLTDDELDDAIREAEEWLRVNAEPAP